jgi:hypothetical protein
MHKSRKRFVKLTSFLAAVCVFFCHGCKSGPEPLSFERLDLQLRSIIQDRNATDESLRQAISRLGPITEPASFWVEITNDPGYSALHRQRCAFAWFRRHGFGGTLVDIGRMLASATWVDEGNIERLDEKNSDGLWSDVGLPPFIGVEGESAFAIRVFPESPVRGVVYLRLLGNVSLDTFIRVVLKGDLNVEPEGAIPGWHVILEWNVSDEYQRRY